MTDTDNKIHELASRAVDADTRLKQARQRVRDAETLRDSIQSEMRQIHEELQKTTGPNISERNILVEGTLVQVTQQSVMIKELLKGATPLRSTKS